MNNSLLKWQNIHMRIFAIFIFIILVILILKIKISFEIYIEDLNLNINVKAIFYKFSKRIKLLSKKTKRKNTKIKKEYVMDTIKRIEIDKINIDIKEGLLFMMPTIIAVPVLSTFLEIIKIIPFKKLKNYKYRIIPEYDKLNIQVNANGIIKIRVLDLVILFVLFQNKRYQ